MGFYFANPLWFVLLAAAGAYLLLVARRSLVDAPRRQRVLTVVARAALVLLLVSALARPRVMGPAKELSVSVLLDLSASMQPEELERNVALARTVAARVRPDQLRVIGFARGAAALPDTLTDEDIARAVASLDREGTDLQGAVLAGLGALKPGTSGRLVILTDGLHTAATLSRAVERARAQQAPVVYFAPAERTKPEIAAAALSVPVGVRPGARFTCTARIESTIETEATLTLYRGGFLAGEREVTLQPGTNLFPFETAFVAGSGRFGRLRLDCVGREDTELRNNTALALVALAERPRVLVVEGREEDGRFLRDALQASDLAVDVRGPFGLPQSLEALASYDLVILGDVPSLRVGPREVANLESYVRNLGGGFVMLGGEQSVTYYGTGVEELLPVSFAGRRKIVDRTVAIVFAVDKSGSMGGQKIELAKSALVASMELVALTDRVGVVVFDQSPKVIMPLVRASRRSEVADQVSRIHASGGTNIYPALHEAYKMLAMATERYKHIILLSDGRSQKADYENLIDQMGRLRITLSTIGIGKGADRELLSQLARLGSGRSYYTDDPMNIPQIFKRETLQVARNAVVDEPFQPLSVRPSSILRGLDMASAPFLLGYVASEPKPAAEVLLASEHGDPVLARWQRGLGRTAFFASDAKNRWAAEWLTWPGYNTFWTQLARDIMRSGAMEHDLDVDLRLANDRLRIELTAIDESGHYAGDGRARATIVGPEGAASTVELKLTAPGLYGAETPARAVGVHNVAVTFTRGDKSVTVNRGVALQYPAEFTRMKPDADLLANLAEATGGWRADHVGDLFRPVQGAGRTYHELWPWLVAAALVVFLLDLLIRRLNFGVAGSPRIMGKSE